MPQRIPLQQFRFYKPGQNAIHNGNQFVIDHVTVRSDKLLVHLEGVRDPVASEHVDVEVSVIDFNRDNGGPRAYVLKPEKPDEAAPSQDLDELLAEFLA
jgi:hypothetical protein